MLVKAEQELISNPWSRKVQSWGIEIRFSIVWFLRQPISFNSHHVSAEYSIPLDTKCEQLLPTSMSLGRQSCWLAVCKARVQRSIWANQFATKPWKYCQDPTSTYLGLRFNERADFKTHLEEEQIRRIEHEEERIRETRFRFRSYENKKHLMIGLRDSRKSWILERTKLYVHSEMQQCNGDSGRSTSPNLSSWLVSETEYQHHNEFENKDPTHGFKAGVMYFEKTADAGWQGHTAPHDKSSPVKNELIQGTFPNQKISMQSLLDEEINNPITQQYNSGDMPEQLRYFHLPTNNMRWVKVSTNTYERF